jgi:PAS domain S-box-containing protein
MEEEQKSLHDRFLTVLDSIVATIYVADIDSYEILFMNKQIKDVFGGDFTGKRCWQVFRNEVRPCSNCTNDRLCDESGNPTGVCIWEGQNPITGKWYNNCDRAIKWVDGRIVRLQIAMDITERKRMEEALRESEKKYRNIIDNIEDGYYEVDTAGNFTFLNNSTCRILGYSADELMVKNNREYTDDNNAKKMLKIYKEVYRTGIPTKAYDWELIRKDGSKCFVETVVSLITDSNNVKTGFRGIARDITERKQAEEEKAKIEEQYRQAQKMEAIGQLAGGVAHDFNNMLNIILGYSQLALMKLEPNNQLHANIREIISAARRSSDLVRQLLAFARKQTIAPKVMDLNDTVAGMLNMLRKLIGEDIDLLWMPAANLWPVKMDPTQIDQLLANLAVNARDSISGVGKITIVTGKAEFDDAYCAQNAGFVPGHYATLAVSDNGCGMDKDTLEKIFEPFFTTKEVGKGTGMGLATVYGIVKQNNGFINVHSEPGKGATFKIYLPWCKGEGLAIDEPSAHAKPLTGMETVLLVEDNEALLKMAKIMLGELGYTVLAAGSPDEAIKLAEQYTGDIPLLVTDVVMPEMSGRDLQKRLTALRPDMKFLFMSGYTANVIAHRGTLDEGIDFLQKPFSMNDLAAKVREALGKEERRV